MIFDLIITVLLYVANFIIGFLPVASLDSNVITPIANIGSSLYFVNYFFDGSQLLTIVGLVLTIEIIINGFRAFDWIFHKVRG